MAFKFLSLFGFAALLSGAPAFAEPAPSESADIRCDIRQAPVSGELRPVECKTIDEVQGVEINATAEASGEKEKSKRFFLIPAYIMGQTGAYLGHVTLGTGWRIGGGVASFDLNVQVGYSPALLGGEDVVTLSTKVEWHPFRDAAIEVKAGSTVIRFDPAYIGVAALYGIHDALFVTVPSQYPEAGYYKPTALHWMPILGTAVTFNGRHQVFFELTALDEEIYAHVNDWDHHDWDSFAGFGTWGIGYRFIFK